MPFTSNGTDHVKDFVLSCMYKHKHIRNEEKKMDKLRPYLVGKSCSYLFCFRLFIWLWWWKYIGYIISISHYPYTMGIDLREMEKGNQHLHKDESSFHSSVNPPIFFPLLLIGRHFSFLVFLFHRVSADVFVSRTVFSPFLSLSLSLSLSPLVWRIVIQYIQDCSLPIDRLLFSMVVAFFYTLVSFRFSLFRCHRTLLHPINFRVRLCSPRQMNEMNAHAVANILFTI